MERQHVDGSIVIDAPIDFVWSQISDPSLYVEGIDWVFEAHVEGGGDLQQGRAYVERAKPGPREGIYRWEVTEWVPPTRQVHSHEGGELAADLTITLDVVDDSTTKYSQSMDFIALPRFRPLGFILERLVMRRQMKKDFEEMILPNYKRIIESRHRARGG